MKHTIWLVIDDEHNCSTVTTIHTTKESADAQLRCFMHQRIEAVKANDCFGDDETRGQLSAIEQHIALGELDEAWELFDSGDGAGEPLVKHPDDHYSCEQHEIELPESIQSIAASTPSSTLADFAAAALEIMEHEPEWDAELLDRLAEEATTRGLADTNGEDGMFRRTPAKENTSDVTQKLRWFIVHGRLHGDDDDSAIRYHAATKEDAEAMFREEMGEENGACILTAENMHTKGDCTAHEHDRIEDGPGRVFIITTFDCGEHEPQCV